ncbi:MAG: type III-A CRISPR-associated RAMP protein Csm5 [candidate division WOR-3 bacterium]
MKIKIRILTPVHIGSGEEISPLEYLIVNNQYHRISMDTLFADPEFQKLMEEFIKLAETQRYIGDVFPTSLLRRHLLYSLPITGEAQNYLRNNKTVVKEFIKSAGRVYIPGSSLKGSILSAIFWDSLKKAYNSETFWNIKTKQRVNPLLAKEFITQSLQGRFRYDELLNFAFFRFATGAVRNRFAHWLDAVDSDRKLPSDVLQISLARVRGARRGGALPILYETLKEGVEFSAEIKSQNTILSEGDILSITNQFYRKVLEKDGNEINTDGILIRLGQGSTAYATSCLILAEELGIQRYQIKPPRTRKRIDEKIPLGWAEIRTMG